MKQDSTPKPQFPRIQPAMLDRLVAQADELAAVSAPKVAKPASRWPRLRVW
ncbi:MAG: hypothetical protein ABF248_09635 [Yoonia sp.]